MLHGCVLGLQKSLKHFAHRSNGIRERNVYFASESDSTFPCFNKKQRLRVFWFYFIMGFQLSWKSGNSIATLFVDDPLMLSLYLCLIGLDDSPCNQCALFSHLSNMFVSEDRTVFSRFLKRFSIKIFLALMLRLLWSLPMDNFPDIFPMI